MKPFNLEEARAGKPICTRNGDKARIICTDIKCLVYHIVAAVWDSIGEQEEVLAYTDKGEHCEGTSSDFDLFMVEQPQFPFKPFDRVLVRDDDDADCCWNCSLFSHYDPYDEDEFFYFVCVNGSKSHMCIPYNEETEHLIGTTDAPPEKYVIW